jgi:hypothetical protein
MPFEELNPALVIRCAFKLAHGGHDTSVGSVPWALALGAVLALLILLIFPFLELFDASHLIFKLLAHGILLLSDKIHSLLNDLFRPQ